MRGVEAGAGDREIGRRRIRRAAGDGRAGLLRQNARRRRMVAMRMGDEDIAQRSPAMRGEQRLDMRGVRRAGVDDRHLAFADDVAASAREGEGAGIGRDDAARQRRHALQRAGRRVEGGEEIIPITRASLKIASLRHGARALWPRAHWRRAIARAGADRPLRSSIFCAITWTTPDSFCTRPVTATRRAPMTSGRCRSNSFGQTTILAIPVSSSIVMKMTPLAEPGRCRTSTRPATVTRAPSRAEGRRARRKG